jgi:hypothetical protein
MESAISRFFYITTTTAGILFVGLVILFPVSQYVVLQIPLKYNKGMTGKQYYIIELF